MRMERGSALVQVLVMSVLLIILATGVMKVMFMNHMMVARVRTGETLRDMADRCYAMRSKEWQGSPCNGPTNCDFGQGRTVTVTCAGSQVTMTANW